MCPDAEADRRVKFLATQARENRPYYYHEVTGYNYRLSNVCAAIGCAQMEDIQPRVNRRRAIHDMYVKLFADSPFVSVHSDPGDEFDSNYWLTTVQLSGDAPVTPDELRAQLLEKHIETRLMWYPMHLQPVFKDMPYYSNGVSEELFAHGLCLPSSSCLTDSDVLRVANAIKSIVE